jgi:peptide/nickel transport system permease protein
MVNVVAPARPAFFRWLAPLARLRRPPLIPTLILVVFVVTALFAPLLAPHDPTAVTLRGRLLPPAWQEGGNPSYLLGTDKLGRDILSRMIYGSRVSLAVAVAAIFFAGTVGSLLGLVAGYFGGITDRVISTIADMFVSLPPILLALVIAAALGPAFWNVVLVVGIVLWAKYCRQVRAEVLSVREREFVLLARVAGASPFRVMFRHLLPNVTNTIIVLGTLQVGWVILTEASLSFLGAGIPPPAPAWGQMVADGRSYITTAWWLSLLPGLAITVTIISINLLGDWLRDLIDPKLRQL